MIHERKLISTNYVLSNGVKVWKLEGTQVYVLAGSLILGFWVMYKLMDAFDCPLLTSLIIGSLFPLVTTVVLLTLVVDKPSSYLMDWLNWQYARLTKTSLIKIKNKEFFSDGHYTN